MSTSLIVGMMSGTSADGIDAVLVKFASENEFQLIETLFTPYSKELRDAVNLAAQKNYSPADLPALKELDTKLCASYASAANALLVKAHINKKDVSCLANHGQTISHSPNSSPPYSLQLGSGAQIAELTNLPTITQFRQADLEAGGQGAPLMPAFHQSVIQGSASRSSLSTTHNYVLNLGGIANLTKLGSDVVGFDTGPANTLLDQWITKHKGLNFDKNGAWAACGRVNEELLQQLLTEPYFHQAYPKSTGPDYFNLSWVDKMLTNTSTYRPEDIQSTLLQLTVESVAMALEELAPSLTRLASQPIYVCGGGAHNTELMTRLRNRLSSYNVMTSQELGIPADWVEAIGFAWLGYCHQKGIFSNLPSVTGANKLLVLGESFQPHSVAEKLN